MRAVVPEIGRVVTGEIGARDLGRIQTAAKTILADRELEGLIERVFIRGEPLVPPDREAIINVLVTRTKLTRDEAGRTVDNWQDMAMAAKARLAQAATEAEVATREAADAAARGVSKASIWAFFGMVFGLVAAAFGAWLGAPDHTALRKVSVVRPAA